MTNKNLSKFYFGSSIQNEIHKTLYDLAQLHPFFSSHTLIKRFIDELSNRDDGRETYIDNKDLISLRNDIAIFIGELSRQTLRNSPDINVIRLSEQNILAIGFEIVTHLISHKEVRAYQAFLNSQESDEVFELDIDEILRNSGAEKENEK